MFFSSIACPNLLVSNYLMIPLMMMVMILMVLSMVLLMMLSIANKEGYSDLFLLGGTVMMMIMMMMMTITIFVIVVVHPDILFPIIRWCFN